MTHQTETPALSGRSETVFTLIRVVLVALSVGIAGAVAWYTVDPATLTETVNPAVIGTIVFTLVVVVVSTRATRFISRPQK